MNYLHSYWIKISYSDIKYYHRYLVRKVVYCVGALLITQILLGCSTEAVSTLNPTPTIDQAKKPVTTLSVAPTNIPITISPSTTPIPPCVVIAPGLNLRSGPGVEYEPAIALLENGTFFTPLGRNVENEWLSIQVSENGQTGWVRARPEYIDCSTDTTTLVVVEAPPTPTMVSTPTIDPTEEVAISQTPTRIADNSTSELEQDFFNREDVPPTGIEPLLSIAGTGNAPPCQPVSQPTIEFGYRSEDNPFMFAESIIMCVHGFEPNKDITITTIRADGTIEEKQAITNEQGLVGDLAYTWTVVPTGMEGSITITAIQGDLQAEITLGVINPSSPLFSAIDDSNQRGEDVQIAMAGFPTNQNVDLFLYEFITCPNDISFCAKYITKIPPAQTDSYGQAIYNIPTSTDTRTGSYMVLPLDVVLSWGQAQDKMSPISYAWTFYLE